MPCANSDKELPPQQPLDRVQVGVSSLRSEFAAGQKQLPARKAPRLGTGPHHPSSKNDIPTTISSARRCTSRVIGRVNKAKDGSVERTAPVMMLPRNSPRGSTSVIPTPQPLAPADRCLCVSAPFDLQPLPVSVGSLRPSSWAASSWVDPILIRRAHFAG